MQIMFSVIVPAFNVSPYISECLESLTKQRVNDYEVIIVDDGSTDGTSQICDKYVEKDRRFKVIHKENGGIVSSRQAGANVARGQYIVCVDGDDYVSENLLSTFKAIIESFHCDVVCCDYYEVFGNNLKKVSNAYRDGFYDRGMMKNELFPSLLLSKAGKAFPAQLWAKAFKAEIYKREHSAVNPGIVMGEDIACTCPSICNSSSAYITHEPLYFYRINPDSVTRRKKVFSWDNIEMRHKHLMERMVICDYSFEDQIFRNTLVGLFTVSRSQLFDSSKQEKEVRREIKCHLKSDFCKTVVSHSFFRSIKLNIIKLSIKHRCVLFMKAYNNRG